MAGSKIAGVTVSQRTKEQAHDYRYFPEPDLPPLRIEESQVSELYELLPELPAARMTRFVAQYALRPADAAVLTAERQFPKLRSGRGGSDAEGARSAANWIVNDLMGLQRRCQLPPEQLPFTPAQISICSTRWAEGLTARAAKELLPQMQPGEMPPAAAPG